MRITLQWFLTGNQSKFEDKDEILGPNTTALELKGFIQMRFLFPANRVVLILNKRLLENHQTLGAAGLVDQASADANVILAHVVNDEGKGGGLEKSNLEAEEEEEDDDDDDSMEFFTHEQFITAMKLLGKDVPVSETRIEEVRKQPPRQRPQFLNKMPPAESTGSDEATATAAAAAKASSSGGATTATDGDASHQHQLAQARQATEQHPGGSLKGVFENFAYGLRTLEAEAEFAVRYPGVADEFQYWDMRLPEDQEHVGHLQENELCLELFFFGYFKDISPENFGALVQQMLQTKGFKVRCPIPPREAGCMYPLIAVPLLMTETEGWELGGKLFEHFGKKFSASEIAMMRKERDDKEVALGDGTSKKPKPGGGCAPM